MPMQRGSFKHGPQRDDVMAHEVEGYVRAGHDTRAEEWRSLEPPGDDLDDLTEGTEGTELRRAGPPAGGPAEGMSARDVRERSELARWLGRAVFPAGREEVVEHLRVQNAPDAVIDKVRRAPADMVFGSSGELWRALHGGEKVESHRY